MHTYVQATTELYSSQCGAMIVTTATSDLDRNCPVSKSVDSRLYPQCGNCSDNWNVVVPAKRQLRKMSEKVSETSVISTCNCNYSSNCY